LRPALFHLAHFNIEVGAPESVWAIVGSRSFADSRPIAIGGSVTLLAGPLMVTHADQSDAPFWKFLAIQGCHGAYY